MMVDQRKEAGESGRGADTGMHWYLVAPHRERLLRIARRRCRTEADAEDCVHEAMTQVALRPSLSEHEVGPLLTRVVLRRASDVWRRHLRDHRLASLSSAELSHSSALCPEDIALDRCQASWLAAESRRLSFRERQVLAQYASGRGVAEAARALNISYKAAESALGRARVAMRLLVAAAGSLVLALRRRLARVLPASSTAFSAIAVGLLTLTVPGGPGSGSTPAVTSPARSVRTAAPGAPRALPAWVGAPAAEAPVGGATPGSAARSPRRPPSAGTTVARVGPVGDPKKAVGTDGPVLVTIYDPGDDLLISTVTCIRQGPSLSLPQLGCPPPH